MSSPPIIACGLEEQADGYQEEKRAWDMVVVLVVEQTADPQEGGLTTRIYFMKHGLF